MPALKLFLTFGVLLIFWNFANAASLKLPINEQVDEIFAKLRVHLQENGLDHFDLPTDSDTFNATLFNSTLEGSVWVGDGSIEGLSTIHRTGDMAITLKPIKGTASAQGHVGFTDLQGHYESSFHLGPFRSRFDVSIKVTTLSAALKLEAGIASPQNIRVLDCSIDELRTLKVKLRGLGLLDSRFYSLLINAFTQILQPILQEALQNIACGILQNAFP